MMRSLSILLLLGLALACRGEAVRNNRWFADDPPLLGLDAGAAQILDSDPMWAASLHYRPAARWHNIGPWFLAGVGEQGAHYAFAGALLNLHLGGDWFFTPSFGPGYYEDNGSYDLGSCIEFRSAAELSRRFPNDHRLGLGFAHISNGLLSGRNPGTEVLFLLYTVPLGRR